MSIAMGQMLRELEQRVAARERVLTASPRRYGVLYAQAARKRAEGDALKAEVAAVMAAHPGQKAYAIRSYLTREPPPCLRRVQQVMRELKRNTADVAQSADAHSGTQDV